MDVTKGVMRIRSLSWAAARVLMDDTDATISPKEREARIMHMAEAVEEEASRLIEKLSDLGG
ncbi:hypothetical protein SAMN04488052_102223 [Aquisalimonas asiatica]|uniref:Uncharacterized protein n=2 Tax=Aquisalimonas asiatica TaxID=406100 RepID=A0A1H8RSN2_9GAMM|nr:hypothetical protein SAMN04488052_102223 [Aquisalimonas asiatica]